MYSAIERQQLLNVARETIQHGLSLGTRMDLDIAPYNAQLTEMKASFVTLKIDDLLRGCIGNIRASSTLIESVAYNAFSAAFNDPRFGPLRTDELPLLYIEISILSELEPLDCSSEQVLLEQLRPQQDGLLISAGEHSATFLPTVWQQLPDPRQFLYHLKEKAGLGADEWPSGITAERYTTRTVSRKTTT